MVVRVGEQGLAGSGRSKRRQGRLVLYAIPIIAVALTATVLALSYNRPGPIMCSDQPSKPVVMDFTVAVSIQVVNKIGNQTRFIVTPSIGVPNGIWATSIYNAYGTNGRYPLCSDPPAPGSNYPGYNTLHVTSTAYQNYTLRDFFNVWGQPLGRNATDVTMNPSLVYPAKGWQWEMCIGNPTSPTNLRLGNWTYEPLLSGRFITLVYYYTNSAYPGCFG